MPPKEKTLNSQPETVSDRELMERMARQLDHLDEMLHEVTRFIDEHRPALAKALAFLDPGKSVRDYLRHRKDPKGAPANGSSSS